jgi:alpha-glucosidase (family GH31 glycosyl hydrolase)
MIEIIHTPYGQEHPYEQLPEERFPRHPLAGTPFTIGIVTRPPEAVKSVRVHTWVNGVEQPIIEADLQPNWQPQLEEGVGAEFLERIVRYEQDVWNASLTAPQYGQTLVYRVEADDGTYTPEFMIRGESWQRGGGLTVNNGIFEFSPSGESLDFPGLLQVEWLTDGHITRRVRLSFRAAFGERFFGFGERFNALDQRGNVLDIRVYEQYKNQGKRTYMPIPFLLSSEGYGIWVESSRWMQFDLCASQEDVWRLEADLPTDAQLRLHRFTGDALQVVAQFARKTGPVVLPPEWSFGLWMSGNEWNSQARVEHEVSTSLEHGIQPSVLVIEAWSDETTFYIFNDAQYTPKSGSEYFRDSDFTFPPEGKWTDPKAMVDKLHAQGIRVLLWQVPVMKILENDHPQHSADHAHFVARQLGVRERDGSLHKVLPFWFRGGYLWDVTNDEAREWWLNKRAYLLEDIGIDGFKTDGGEHLWGTEVVFADGRTGADVWNEYPQRYTQAYYEFTNSKREGITFSRAGFTHSQRSPLHWAGDEHSTWDAFRHSIYAGLSASLSGISFWGWDFAGFSGAIPSAELYLRAAAMATFCPVMQYHSEYNAHREPSIDRTPWNIQARTGDTRVIPVFRHFVNLRHHLMPYIWREAQHSAATGEPMMRALKLWYPQADDFQYFFGRDLLVSPVVVPEIESQRVYLPPGEWRDFWTDERYTGDQYIDVLTPIDRIPVFIRGEAVDIDGWKE